MQLQNFYQNTKPNKDYVKYNKFLFFFLKRSNNFTSVISYYILIISVEIFIFILYSKTFFSINMLEGVKQLIFVLHCTIVKIQYHYLMTLLFADVIWTFNTLINVQITGFQSCFIIQISVVDFRL